MPLALRSTCIVESPEIVRAPLVVKVPITSGNVEKSYVAVMVTGVGLGADWAGPEPIVKKAITHSAISRNRGRSKVFRWRASSCEAPRIRRVVAEAPAFKLLFRSR